jgi:hypothetical protein
VNLSRLLEERAKQVPKPEERYSSGFLVLSSLPTASALLATFSIAAAISSFDAPKCFTHYRTKTSSDRSMMLRSGGVLLTSITLLL